MVHTKVAYISCRQKFHRVYRASANVAPLNLDIYRDVCERSEQEKKSDCLKLKKRSTTKTVAAAKNHINKKNYSMKYHVILGRFNWLINGFTEFMIEQ